MYGTRKVTNKLLEMIEEGALDAETVVRCCLNYMSEDDVAEMAHREELLVEEEEEDEEEEGEGDTEGKGWTPKWRGE